MNIFSSGADSVKKLETQLKQKQVQLDNLDNALNASKKDAADQRGMREALQQEAYQSSRRQHELEVSVGKLEKVLKQKEELCSRLSLQADARLREAQKHEKCLRKAQSESGRLARELEDLQLKCQNAESEGCRSFSNVKALEAQIAALKAAHAQTLSAQSSELHSAQRELAAKQTKLDQCENMLHSEHVNSDNWNASIENLKTRLKSLDEEHQSEAASRSRCVGELEEQVSAHKLVAAQSSSKAALLEAALAAEQAKNKQLSSDAADRLAHAEALAAQNTDLQSKLDTLSAASKQSHGQEAVQIAALQKRVSAGEAEVKSQQQLLASAASEIERLSSLASTGSACNDTLQTQLANAEAVLIKRGAPSDESSPLKDALRQISALEEEAQALRSNNKDVTHSNESLREQASRSMDTVRNAQDVQKRLEAKYAKRTSERDAARDAEKAAQARVAELQACLQNAQTHIAQRAGTPASAAGDPLHQAAAESQDKIYSLQTSLQQAQQAHKETLTALQAANARLSEQARASASSSEAMQAVQAKADDHAATVQGLEQTVATLQQQLADAKCNATAALERAKPPVPDDTLAKQAKTLQQQLAAEQKAVAEGQQKACSLQEAIAAKDSRLSVLQQELEALEADKAGVVKELQGAQREAAAAVQEQQRQREQLRKADAALAQLREQVADAKAEITAAREEIAGAVSEKDAFAKQASEQHAQLIAVQQDLSKQKAVNVQMVEDHAQASESQSFAAPAPSIMDRHARDQIADLQQQLRTEQEKHKDAKQALLSEQAYFASEIAALERVTKDEPVSTPSGQVHTQLQKIKQQLSAVADGANLSVIKHRTMVTPAQPRFTPPPAPAASMTPRATPPSASGRPGTGQRPGTASTAATSRTPLSALGTAANDADYWHRKYEEQASQLQSLHQQKHLLEKQLLRSGTLAALGMPQDRRASLSAFASAAKRQSLNSEISTHQLECAAADMQTKLQQSDEQEHDCMQCTPRAQHRCENEGDVNLMPPQSPNTQTTPQLGQ